MRYTSENFPGIHGEPIELNVTISKPGSPTYQINNGLFYVTTRNQQLFNIYLLCVDKSSNPIPDPDNPGKYLYPGFALTSLHQEQGKDFEFGTDTSRPNYGFVGLGNVSADYGSGHMGSELYQHGTLHFEHLSRTNTVLTLRAMATLKEEGQSDETIINIYGKATINQIN